MAKREVEEIVDNLTLFDDDLMSRVFDNNIPATELLLSIILGQKIKVISVVGQKEMKNHEVGKRNIKLDVHAMDEENQEIDVEVQRGSEGAHIRRSRFNSAMMDSRMLKEKQDFKELKDSYVIFIYEHDKFNKGLPIYHIDRYVRETNEPVNDGSHIIYVNGAYQGDDPLGQLIADFHQKESSKMHYKELAESVEHFKVTKKGRGDMCEAVENYARKEAEKAVKKATKKATERATITANLNAVNRLMIEMKMTLEQALDFLALDSEQRVMVEKQIKKQ